MALVLCMLLVCANALAAVEIDAAALKKDLGITKDEFERGVDFTWTQLLGFEVT